MVKKLDAAQYYSKGSEQPNSLRKYELAFSKGVY